MQLLSQYLKLGVAVRSKYDEGLEQESKPHIQIFERQIEFDTMPDGEGVKSLHTQANQKTQSSPKRQAAILQSERIFGPFSPVPQNYKPSFVKIQQRSFLHAGDENS